MKTSCLLILILALALPGATYGDPVTDPVNSLWQDLVIWVEALVADVLPSETLAGDDESNTEVPDGTDPAGFYGSSDPVGFYGSPDPAGFYGSPDPVG